VKDLASQQYSSATREGVAVIDQTMLNGAARRHSARLHNFMPVEADPADWAEQQQPVPLPDDEYPYDGGDRRVLITTLSALEVV
jgi:hypothetical protein